MELCDVSLDEVFEDRRTGGTKYRHYYNQDNLIEIAKLLIEKDVDINAEQSDGWTALHLLCGFYTRRQLV